MNIRKNSDYSEMYDALDILIAQQLPQMELYCKIGKAVCRRTEKGAAVMASEYLNKNYPDVKGFSPRNLRRMRDFYRTYENHPTLLSRAMKLGWIQNVVIMEADLTMDLRKWYMKAAEQFGWSKAVLIENIITNAYEHIVIETEEELVALVVCVGSHPQYKITMLYDTRYSTSRFRNNIRLGRIIWRYSLRPWNKILWKLFIEIPPLIMRC